MSLPLALEHPASQVPVIMETSPEVIPKMLSCGNRITWLRLPLISREPPKVYESEPPLPEKPLLCGVHLSGKLTGPALTAVANKQSASNGAVHNRSIPLACFSVIFGSAFLWETSPFGVEALTIPKRPVLYIIDYK